MKTYFFDEIPVGMEASFEKHITDKHLCSFSDLTGDKNPLHTDDKFAKNTTFKRRVVFGHLVNSFLSTLAGMHLPGKNSLILSCEAHFRKPAFVNDTLTISGTVVEKLEVGQLIVVETRVINQEGDVLQTGKMRIQVME